MSASFVEVTRALDTRMSISVKQLTNGLLHVEWPYIVQGWLITGLDGASQQLVMVYVKHNKFRVMCRQLVFSQDGNLLDAPCSVSMPSRDREAAMDIAKTVLGKFSGEHQVRNIEGDGTFMERLTSILFIDAVLP